jgi:RNA polymerase sigma factor (sigma-70 family)
MEALSTINSNTVIKQPNTIVARETNKEVCKNRIEMPFDDLLKDTVKKLMPYAMFLTYKNEADSEDLVQYTIEKLIKNKDKFLEHPKPMAYAKLILKNKSRDDYRKQNKNVSIEANNIPVANDGFQHQSYEFKEMLDCLEAFDETDRTILAMLGAGNSYEEIQEVVSDISMANLRVKANRARIRLANCIGKKL